MNADQSKFLLKEYDGLRQELLQLARGTYFLEAAVVAGIAGIYAWLAVHPDTLYGSRGWWLPFLLVVFGALRYFAMMVRILEYADYLRRVEQEFLGDLSLGWERFLSGKRRSSLGGMVVALSAGLAWLTLLVLTAAIALRPPTGSAGSEQGVAATTEDF
jgi:hypothetical protein